MRLTRNEGEAGKGKTERKTASCVFLKVEIILASTDSFLFSIRGIQLTQGNDIQTTASVSKGHQG